MTMTYYCATFFFLRKLLCYALGWPFHVETQAQFQVLSYMARSTNGLSR